MKRQPQSTLLTFVLDNQQTLDNIDHLKLHDYEKFKSANHIGTLIQAAAKDDDPAALQALFDQHHALIPFLKLQIEDAFISALHLRNYQAVKYFLQNGFSINTVAEDAPLTLAYSLQYLHGEQAPLDLLQLVLSFGANPRRASDQDSQTPLHLAAQQGHLGFIKTLLDYGADINAVSDDRQTPVGVAMRCKRGAAVEFLKGKGGNERWDA